MKVTNTVQVTMLVVIVVLFCYTYAAPNSQSHRSLNEPDSDVLTRWILDQLVDVRRDRRTEFDAGLLSRHSALHNFLNSYDAAREAADPDGPGRRK
uniref:Uncharacterized protein n=1 Tax=Arion vulgaris TaxID=1028688 RepID=A0A0B7A6R4_9EUPU